MAGVTSEDSHNLVLQIKVYESSSDLTKVVIIFEKPLLSSDNFQLCSNSMRHCRYKKF